MAHQKAEHVARMARCLQDPDRALADSYFISIPKNSRDRARSKSDIIRVNARAFRGRQADCFFVASFQGMRRRAGSSYFQPKPVAQEARTSRMIEMTMGEKKKADGSQGNPVLLEIFDQSFGLDAATRVDQCHPVAAMNGIDIAVAVVRQRATKQVTCNEVNAVRDLQSSRSFT
jgi:hypothetical protein